MGARAVARVLTFLLVLSFVPVALAAADPKQFIGKLGDEVVGILQDEQLDRRARADRFRALFSEAFDVPTISQFVLGRHWREATPEQRAQWQAVLKDYVAGIYARQFSTYKGRNFEVLQQRKVDGGAVVHTRIEQANGEPIEVDFRVQKVGDELKIVDVLVANVSLIVTKRAEFDSVIQREGVEGLMARLRRASAQATASG